MKFEIWQAYTHHILDFNVTEMIAGDIVELVEKSIDRLVDDKVAITFLWNVVLYNCVLLAIVVCMVRCDPCWLNVWRCFVI